MAMRKNLETLASAPRGFVVIKRQLIGSSIAPSCSEGTFINS